MNYSEVEIKEWETIQEEIIEERGKAAFEKDRNYFTKEFNWFRERKATGLYVDLVYRWRSELKDARVNENRNSVYNPMGYLTTMTKQLKESIPNSKTTSLMRLEGNLIEFPYFRFGARSSDPILFETERKHPATNSMVKVNWETKTTSLIPNDEDKDVLMALIKLWNDNGKNPDGTVYFTKSEVATILNRPYDGKTCQHIENAIEYFFDLNIKSGEAFLIFNNTAENQIFLNNLGAKTGLRIIENFKFYIPGKDTSNTDELFKSEVRFSKEIISNMLLFYSTEIDWNFYTSLNFNLSKRIYEILQKRKGSDNKNVWISKLIPFAARIGISIKKPRNIKNAMAKALFELQDTHYITSYEIYKKESVEYIKFIFKQQYSEE